MEDENSDPSMRETSFWKWVSDLENFWQDYHFNTYPNTIMQ